MYRKSYCSTPGIGVDGVRVCGGFRIGFGISKMLKIYVKICMGRARCYKESLLSCTQTGLYYLNTRIDIYFRLKVLKVGSCPNNDKSVQFLYLYFSV